MKDIARWTCLAAVGFALAACTGTSDDMETELGMPTVEEKARMDYARIASQANILLYTDNLGYHEGETTPVRTQVECKGRICSKGFSFLFTPAFFSVDTVELEIQQGLNGMRKVIERKVGGEYADTQVVGGWMEHSLFATEIDKLTNDFATEIDKLTNDIYPETNALTHVAYAFGRATGANPTVPEGGATWVGFMVGRDVSLTESRESYIEGEARIDVDLGSSNGLLADIAFTHLYNRHTGQAHGDMRWNNLDIERGAFSDRNSESDRIDGQFFGPEQEEVAGTFERSGISGAFGGVATD